MSKLVNEQCRDQAEANIKLGNFHMAMRWFNTAAARTIGHKKTEMYEGKARWCADQIEASYDGGNYAEDWEAIDLRPTE